ncbi:UDP-N-acetylglucosamine 2-epimerase (non-hydrolyzing) [Actinosynnema sp. NPDC047251]|uniref:UDP-N-acetylglucosamine 2-epimerase (non-hydrolyzing) n=1 Tax=Saccharothrix espanaensis (strain ATCC 51144 / DSM 44229 / JCM 9112 / NBRC 15066 / NRRL 15764) TaxID=1179773 RepID=K0JWB6_SACES|nr:UDP-N-acetylglucosamine 2-epimerase (non-hydrolyzing) [Saccharothrix espanaensis]CCH28483.1 UDP-N-acetylglucosamine 2-epimerase [Saccharothrix espanaensis DSM 44229]
MKEVLLLAGTRPEAVKIAPVALALADHPVLRPLIVHSGQHEGLVEQALGAFDLKPDIVLTTPRVTGSQAELVAALVPALDQVLRVRDPAVVLVQGDTTTALAGALAAFWRGIPVAHLEAGLRTGDLAGPFPEEGTRQMIARIAALHLAPTDDAATALVGEALPAAEIVVTGNTVVDAVRRVAAAALPVRDPALAALEADLDATGDRLVLVTVHRRESWGAPLERVLHAVRALVDRHPDVRVLLPAHPNPALRATARQVLGGHARIVVGEPLDYPDLVRALRRSALVLTDSGGIQEEAPSFGVPVLVLRSATERMSAVDAGCAWLVGTDTTRILAEAGWILGSRLRLPPGRNPFGDGRAAIRVRGALERLVGSPALLAPLPVRARR